MFPVRDIQGREIHVGMRGGDLPRALAPLDEPELLVREPVQLQVGVGVPLEGGVRLVAEPVVQQRDGGLEEERDRDDEGARHEGEAQPEHAEGGVSRAVDFLDGGLVA